MTTRKTEWTQLTATKEMGSSALKLQENESANNRYESGSRFFPRPSRSEPSLPNTLTSASRDPEQSRPRAAQTRDLQNHELMNRYGFNLLSLW